MQIDRVRIHESATHEFAAEASDLGWAPGQWPQTVTVPGIGNGQPFNRSKLDETGAVYTQQFGCVTLRVWND